MRAPHRLTSGDHRIDFTHDAAGRELTRVLGNAITMNSAWDEAGRLSAQHITAGARAVNSRAYSYRADGHLTSVADGLSGTRTFDLDRAGRVTAVHAQGWTERYAYDEAGSQTSASWPSGHPAGHEATGPRTYTGTTITRAGDVRFEHDALGRVTLRQKTRLSRKPDTWRYTWDTENHLTSVTTPDGTRWRYRYDQLGRRTAKQRLANDGESVVEEIRFTWDGLTLCEQTAHGPDQPNTVALTWDHRGHTPLAQTERILTADDRQHEIDRRFFAIATDLIGAPTELIDESGDMAWRTRSTLWGATAWARDSSAYTPLRFPGQYFDPETGLHYNYLRYYDPETGRYTSPDPLGLAPAPNPLGYVDNPNTASDPLGLMPKCTKEEKAQKRIDKIVDDVLARAQNGELKKHADYHGDTGHGFTDEQVLEILKKPDAVYHSSGQAGNLLFRKDNDVAVVYGPGAKQGQAITATESRASRVNPVHLRSAAVRRTPVRRLPTRTSWRAGFPPRTATWLRRCRSDEAGMTTKLAFDGDWRATVTNDPLHITPRFAGDSVRIMCYGDVMERERFVANTFGSQHWLWDTPDVFRFDPDSRKLVGAELQMPYVSANHETSPRVPVMPAVRQGGLRADEVRDFRHEMCTVLCRAPGDAVLTSLRDLDVLDEPLDACIGIAPDVALLVQHGTVVGWNLTDPVRYLTTGFADPDPAPPSDTTRRLLSECLDLITTPVVDDLVDGEPAALARFRAADDALRNQQEDRHRADALLDLIATMVEDYADGPTGQKP